MQDDASAAETTPGADTPATQAGTSDFMLAQLALIERSLTAPLSQERRRQLLDYLAEQTKPWSAEEITAVPDGTEPALIFHPVMPAGRALREGSHGHA